MTNMSIEYEMTRGEQRAAHKMYVILKHGDVSVGDDEDIAQRYRNYRKIPEHTMMQKVKLEDVVGDYLENCNWLEESRTYPGSAKARMKWFFIHALDAKMEAQMEDDEEFMWEDYTNTNLRLIKFVKPDGLNRAHDFWFATDALYAHNYSMDNDPDYAHKWMMENDAVYKAAYEAAQEAEDDDGGEA